MATTEDQFPTKKDIAFRRELLSKHSQLMHMYLRHNSIKPAKEQFEIVKSLFNFLHNLGETMYFYTLEDFETDSKRFERM
ncbi:hypothetical protein [Heyndrickxia sporothermodurans]|uniref:hypothetical protein n=1 Tax=Heyndrickxia sporothermodurans TaxID=46224 RepID=UPI000D39EFA2|nr:hypothetical protein [Heyndrickxia sporothermodurans]PTY93042.1 hypothetical protein B5V90_02865 [Heyndrickxia sporothermodurans]